MAIAKNIILITPMNDSDKPETWGSLTRLCNKHSKFKYNTIKAKKYPFKYKGWLFEKLKYNPI